ncbi:hypothetical protein DSM19430T_29170 [Desulfovibrio psychrotolerans]|uniref:Uncharacterized protein n=2 Tax=Desulfovibrio psychrotolerans TaxID=415242 RepID=A0A7J0BX16_9BACT|nr:hypothetical protein DSM19430T_29170 [Desulfovibrio psychrotolerans]
MQEEGAAGALRRMLQGRLREHAREAVHRGMPPRARYRPGREGGTFLLSAVIVIISLCIAGVALWYFLQPPVEVAAYHRVLLLDRSDPLSRTQAEGLRSIVQQVERETPDDGRVSVYYLDSLSGVYLEPQVSAVAPKRHQGNLMHNEQLAEQCFRKEFMPGIADAVMAVQNASNTEESPIVETLARICRDPGFSPRMRARSMVLHSDMLQNSGLCTEYGRTDAPRCTQALLAAHMPDLSGVNVEILYLRHKKYEKQQTPEHMQMWISLFRNAGAYVRLEQIF